jgi:hypothetical protein
MGEFTLSKVTDSTVNHREIDEFRARRASNAAHLDLSDPLSRSPT